MNEKGLTLDHGQDRRLPVSSQERGSCKSDNSPSTPGSPSTPCAITNAMESCLSRDDRRPATVVTARTTLRGCALSAVRREIGREACRDRVGEYVEISGVPEAIKKQNSNRLTIKQ